MNTKRHFQLLPLLGDLLVLALVTVFGFIRHRTSFDVGTRFLATFVPLGAGWILSGIPLRLFDEEGTKEARQLWRPLWGMVLAAPFAGWLRGLWLDVPVQPLFVLIVGGISAAALVLWRSLYLGLRRWRKGDEDG